MNPLEETGRSTRNIDPCLLVIFGATGDLTGRKLAPAIYNIGKEGLLPANFACVGFARREKSNEEFRDDLKKSISSYSRTQPIDDNFWSTFQEQIFYHKSEFDSDEGYEALAKTIADLDKRFSTRGNRVFYLSVQPKFFPIIVEKLRKFNLIYDVTKETESWSRVVIEKPFGHDLKSAGQLQDDLHKNIDESQTYRIDHYLGKETVQNIMVFRFGNAIFESLWNYKHIDHVQITVAEDIGIGTRGAFYEEEGLLRDVVQNHVMQILSLIGMEPPVSLKASDIHDEKVKVLKSIRPFTEEDFKSIVRGQYGPGFVNGEDAIGYRQEKNVKPDSQIETFLALRLFIDNWRWGGTVPFYIRAGKRLAKRTSEVAIVFKDAPGVLFQEPNKKSEPNVLTLRIQPDEGISMKINCKVPGPSSPLQPVKMDFRYGSYFGQSPPEAYERLFLDFIIGDNTLFARTDEVETSWKIFTPLLEYWAKTPMTFPNYACGTWGPKEADEMIAKDNRTWRKL